MSGQPRQLVLAADKTEDSQRALHWLLKNISRENDVVHVVHVAKVMDETPEIYHGPVGTSLNYREATLKQTEAAVEEEKKLIAEKFGKVLDAAVMKHETHFFLEGENAPADAVANIIERVYNEVGGSLIVASRSNKTWSERWFLGSVAECLSKLPHPLVLVTLPQPQ